jgi:hypothetical protein
MKYALLIAGLISLSACYVTPKTEHQLTESVYDRMQKTGDDNTGGTYCPIEKAKQDLC